MFPMVSRKWLYFGEEEMLSPGTTSRNTLPAASPLLCREMPLLGFADSQLNMSPVKELAKDTVSVSLSIHSIAVKAGGNSMFPAGIQHGHICYCDPDAKPVVDEPVFAMNKLKQGFIKVYLGQSRKEDCTSFKSWNDEHGHFSPHYTDIPNELLELVAPVIFIRLKY